MKPKEGGTFIRKTKDSGQKKKKKDTGQLGKIKTQMCAALNKYVDYRENKQKTWLGENDFMYV